MTAKRIQELERQLAANNPLLDEAADAIDKLRDAAQSALDYLEAPADKLWPNGTLCNICAKLRDALK